jgi:hypothetical protein
MSDNAIMVKSVPLDDEQFALAVLGIKTKEQAKEFLERMIEAKNIVNTLKKFEEYRRHFSILENKAYLQLYERGFHNELREVNGSLVAACRWVLSHKGKKKDDLINGEYGPILSVYRRYVKDKKQQEALISAEKWGDLIVKQFNNDGVVTISTEDMRTMVRHSDSLSGDMAHDIVDGVKDRLLRAGGYGVGNGKYCKITDEYELRDAINIRVKSIKDDLTSILMLVSEASRNGIHLSELTVDWESKGTWRLSADLFIYLWLRYKDKNIKFGFVSTKVFEEYAQFINRLAEEVGDA